MVVTPAKHNVDRLAFQSAAQNIQAFDRIQFMAQQITGYKVFIASPGGLEPERKTFKETVSAHNQADALARKCLFEAVGWEITLGGVGRPQEKINSELRECDLFVLLLWDRWGSPTGSLEGHTSGTEEEYKVAMSCLNSHEYPMRELVVFFKAVDRRQLSDPGPQLSAVLDFKKTLEKEKNILFETFDTPDSFGEKIRRHLAKWTRDHESELLTSSKSTEAPKQTLKSKDKTNIEAVDLKSADPKDNSFIEKIENIYTSGNLTDAEERLVSDIIARKNIQAFYSYGLFLLKSERLTDAKGVFEEMSKLALAGGEVSWAATATARIGGIYRVEGNFRESQNSLEQAIKMKQQCGDEKGEMSANIWLGDLLFQLKQYDNALKPYQSALGLAQKLGGEKLQGDIKFKIAKCLVNMGHTPEALQYADGANELYVAIKDKLSIKSVKQWRMDKGLNTQRELKKTKQA